MSFPEFLRDTLSPEEYDVFVTHLYPRDGFYSIRNIRSLGSAMYRVIKLRDKVNGYKWWYRCGELKILSSQDEYNVML